MNDTHVTQVGGTHYQPTQVVDPALLAAHDLGGIQHWDIMERYDVDYLTATGTKYLMRWRRAGKPDVDLGKSASYLEKALKCRSGQGARRLVPVDVVDAMCLAAGCHWQDRDVMKLVLCSGSHADYEEALRHVQEMAR